MDKLQKFLKKLSVQEKRILENIIVKLLAEDLKGMDVKKLKGKENIFRVRKGDIRIIFQHLQKRISIISFDRRDDNTYK